MNEFLRLRDRSAFPYYVVFASLYVSGSPCTNVRFLAFARPAPTSQPGVDGWTYYTDHITPEVLPIRTSQLLLSDLGSTAFRAENAKSTQIVAHVKKSLS